jgi:DNA-binding MarR family transcriptional regulator
VHSTRIFERLRALKEFEKQHLGVLASVEDQNLVREIGYHQSLGAPLTLKQLFLQDIGSVATVQRRLRRLRQLGVLEQRRSRSDRRAVEVMLKPKYVVLFRRYGELMFQTPGYRHVCGLYGDDATLHETTAAFLAEGLKSGNRCVLMSSPATSEAVLGELERRQKGSRGKVIVRDYADSLDVQMAQFEQLLSGGRRGDSVRIAGEVVRSLEKGMSADDVMAYERRIEGHRREAGVQVLCQYDVRRFSGEDILRSLECHAGGGSPVLPGRRNFPNQLK